MRLSSVNGESVWQFRHPTIGDAYAGTLAQSPEHIDIFIQGSEAEQLIDEITCGDVGFENTIIVPKALFPLMIEKLRGMRSSKSYKSDLLSMFGARGNLQGFLTYRCSREFLSLYLQHDSDVLDEVSEPGLFLGSVPEVSLAKRLHEFGLLPDEHRRRFCSRQ